MLIMDSFFRHFSEFRLSRCTVISVLFFWVSGLLLGMFLAVKPQNTAFSSIVLTVPYAAVTKASLICAVFSPVFFSLALAISGRLYHLYAVAFLKAFLFSFLGVTFLVCYQDAGWLVFTMMMFSQIASLPALCWLWLQLLRNNIRKYPYAVLFCYLITAILLHYYSITPFMERVL